MNDSVLLLTGIAVFSLMLIGIALTVLEFKQLRKKEHSSNREKSDSPASGTRESGARPKVG